MESIFGHKRIVYQLERAIKKDGVSQAYIFSGPQSVGKFTLAKAFAKRLIGNDNLDLTADYVLVEPETEEEKGKKRIKDISVGKIRNFQRTLSITSGGRHKIAIINDAHRMTKSAQNALLKTLEEPSPGVVIILVTHDKNKLLPTIISRCQVKKFGLLSRQGLAEIAPTFSLNDEILVLAAGRPGFLIKMRDDQEELKNRQEIISELKKIIEYSVCEKFEAAESLSKNAPEMQEKMSAWILFLRECLLKKENRGKISQQKALFLVDEINKSLEKLKETNANAKLILENLFLKM